MAKNISEANRMTDYITKLKPAITFVKQKYVCELKLISLSDAVQDGLTEIYGQNGFIYGMISQDIGGQA